MAHTMSDTLLRRTRAHIRDLVNMRAPEQEVFPRTSTPSHVRELAPEEDSPRTHELDQGSTPADISASLELAIPLSSQGVPTLKMQSK